MSILFSTFAVDKEQMFNSKSLKIMANLELTDKELRVIEMVIDDLGGYSEAGSSGGLYTHEIYLTPETCYHLGNALKKLNEYFFDNPQLYKKAFRKYQKGSKSK